MFEIANTTLIRLCPLFIFERHVLVTSWEIAILLDGANFCIPVALCFTAYLFAESKFF